MLKKINPVLLMAITFAVVVSSCQKEVSFQTVNGNGNGNGNHTDPGNPSGPSAIDIKGEWKLDSNRVNTRVTTEVSDLGITLKNVTTSNYRTENNAGTLTITDTKFIFKGVSYSVDAIAHTATYQNGSLMTQFDLPFAHTQPPLDITYDYVRISADSVSFPNGFATISGSPASGSTGAKVKLLNGKLSLQSSVNQPTMADPAGQGTIAYQGSSVMYFRK